MKHSPNILIDGLVFPEGPRWHGGELWFSDIYAHRVIAVSPDGRPRVAAQVDQPSGLGFLPDGSLLIACMRDRIIRRVQNGRISTHADLQEHPGDFINDMVVDTVGNAYVGNRFQARNGDAQAKDSLVLVRPDGTHEIVASNLAAPNGAVITADGAHLILAETGAFCLTMFDCASDGSLSYRRKFAALRPGLLDEGRKPHPDGICLDAEGAIWVGTAASGQYLRIVEGGAVRDRLTPWAPWAVACVLGGENRRTLFMATCTASLEGLRALGCAQGPVDDAYLTWARSHAQGQIEAATVEIGGAGTP